MFRSAARQTLFSLFVLFSLVLTACDNVVETRSDNAAKQTSTEHPVTIPKSQTKQITHMYLGTGSVQGVYFPIGGVICRLLNRKTDVHRIRCTLESTGGSIYNLRELRKGNFDLVFAQSDWQYNAYHGQSAFEKEQANPDLRAVFALEADPLALIVKSDSEVVQFDDLKDKTVSFGYTRSLQRRVMDDYLQAKEISHDYFKEIRQMSDSRQLGELCDGNVDAILFLSSSLNDRLKVLPEGCELKLVAMADKGVNKVIEQNPYYRKGQMPKTDFFQNTDEVMSFGVGATFVASEQTSPKAIYHVVKEVVENFNDFKSLHPSLKQLSKKELPYAGISIPLHPGAVRYYKEARLLK